MARKQRNPRQPSTGPMPAVAQAAQVQRPQPREKITGFNPEEISKKTSHLAYQVADETGYLDGWYRMLFFESNRIGSAVHNKFIRGVEVENDRLLVISYTLVEATGTDSLSLLTDIYL
jgi:hypothetical protein